MQAKSASLAVLLVSLVATSAAADGSVVEVTLHPRSAGNGDTLVVVRDNVIVKTCTETCTLWVPRGEYDVHETRGESHTTMTLDVSEAIDARVIAAERWRKPVGITVGIAGILGTAIGISAAGKTQVEDRTYGWFGIFGGALASFTGFWLYGSTASTTHLESTPLHPTFAVAPLPGGGAIQLACAF
jgi:hypothetical protein